MRTHERVVDLPEEEEREDAWEERVREGLELVDESAERRSRPAVAVDLHLPRAEPLCKILAVLARTAILGVRRHVPACDTD